jgi:beta-phosphoglucomutase-like phosphatase (HAD superfamily)
LPQDARARYPPNYVPKAESNAAQPPGKLAADNKTKSNKDSAKLSMADTYKSAFKTYMATQDYMREHHKILGKEIRDQQKLYNVGLRLATIKLFGASASVIISTSSKEHTHIDKSDIKRLREYMSYEAFNSAIRQAELPTLLKEFFNMTFHATKDRVHESAQFLKDQSDFIRYLSINITGDKKMKLASKLEYAEERAELFKEKLPLLNEINQWICKEDYTSPKPDGECYELAKNKYYKNEKYIIGVEDSMVGYKSLKHHTDLIYIYDNESIFNNNDCYLFNDYNQLNYN